MSRTHHSRITGTHLVGHDLRAYRKEDGAMPSAYRTRDRREGRALIREQMSAPIDLDERWTERECLSEWEALDEWSVVSGPERMADWEIALLTGVEQDEAMSIAWSSVTTEPSAGAFAEADPHYVDDLDEDDENDQPHWLAGDVAEVFPDGGYVVTGPAPQTSVRANGYLRVHEAADLLECTSASLIHRLRHRGEWVTNAASYVARPVIAALYAEGLEPFLSGELTLAERLSA